MNRARAVRGRQGTTSGDYVTGTRTYASSIDSGIANLKADYCYDACFNGGRPILVIMHGYGEDITAIIHAHRWRFARRGFFVLIVAMRGRSGASGSRDASGREVQDIVDAVEDVRADPTLTLLVDAQRVAICGYSGGGANALAALAKAPDFWSYAAAHFAPSDYGWRSDSGWYYTDPSIQAALTTDVGATPSAQPGWWRSRNHADALGYQLALAPRRKLLSLYHDADDPTVDVAQSDRVKTALDDAGLTGLYEYQRSTSASSTRYYHGYPSDHVELELAEEDWWERALNADAWSVPFSGSVLVSGWLRTKLFSVWLGLTSGGANPKTDASGGKVHVARVTYTIDAGRLGGSFNVLPLTGSVRARIEVGASTSTSDITGPITVTI